MNYNIIRNPNYDFVNERYGQDHYPNLHKYPATMIPQLGIRLLKEFCVQGGMLLDPYCGSGSSFVAGLEVGIHEMVGYDLNPLAVLISQARFTFIEASVIHAQYWQLLKCLQTAKEDSYQVDLMQFTNIDYWFHPSSLKAFNHIQACLETIEDEAVRRLFWIPFSETIRTCSYTRTGEFKLYRIRHEDIPHFKPDVLEIYIEKLNRVIEMYLKYYIEKLKNFNITVNNQAFVCQHDNQYDVVLTSPPYGDSQTTVAYGQFSFFGNQWLRVENARQVDKNLMGGKIARHIFNVGIMAEAIQSIQAISVKRALEVSAFYHDLAMSIHEVARCIKQGGMVFYIVGNRTVKGIRLPTDQFIAEQFEQHGFQHIITYERALSHKVMPNKNSPSNESGITMATMLYEYIVILQKVILTEV